MLPKEDRQAMWLGPAIGTHDASSVRDPFRSLQDQGGFYDRGKLFWKGIEDVTIMAACAPSGGGRQDMSSRFTRHMHTLCMPPTSEVKQ